MEADTPGVSQLNGLIHSARPVVGFCVSQNESWIRVVDTH
jgi:hypothetical protein